VPQAGCLWWTGQVTRGGLYVLELYLILKAPIAITKAIAVKTTYEPAEFVSSSWRALIRAITRIKIIIRKINNPIPFIIMRAVFRVSIALKKWTAPQLNMNRVITQAPTNFFDFILLI